MADNTANINVNVSDNGTTKKVTKDASDLNKEFAKAAATAANIRVPTPVAAARAGVVAASTKSTTKIPKSEQNALDSDLARGIGGQTGAAGRDFAAQAQGLGGLVHVYATFAANLFAVSAAFTALSKAANVSNMIKGLDQLGAASGRNLGTLAKSLVEVSDGAISLADSMTAVAQATSGGMSSQNILRMTEVAKKASQALGRDMGDALSRLSRGITKIEPELLDEIGIMVKVNEASDTYARQLGKTASSLTDFEKRQGYANAVLAEGERKFSSINLDANPYQKILASITNLMYSGGELVNKVLGPILKILSDSPTALTAALAAVGGMLLKQAVPAIGSWRVGLEKAAESARNAVIETNKLRIEKSKEVGHDAYTKSNEAMASAQAAQLKLQKSYKAFKEAAAFDITNATKEQLDNLKKVAIEQDKVTNALIEKKGIPSNAVLAKRQAAQDAARELEISTKLYQQQAKIAEAAEAEKLSSVKKGKLARIKEYFSEADQRQRIADSIATKSQRINIVNDAVKAAPTQGIIKSWLDMSAAIGNARKGQDEFGKKLTDGTPKMGLFSASLTMVRGTALLTAAAVSTLAASLANVFAIIGIFTTAFMLLDSWISKSSKELNTFNDAAEKTSSAVDNISRTLDVVNNKKFGESLNTESLQAKATAFAELTDSIDSQSRAFVKLQQSISISWWDKQKDRFKSLFGQGSSDTLANNLSEGIVVGISTIDDPKIKEEVKRKIENIFGAKINFTSLDSIKNLASTFDGTQLAEKAAAITKAFQDTSLQINNSASALTTFKTGMTETAKLVDSMNNKLKPSDDLGKIGIQMITDSYNLNAALQDPIHSLAALQDLIRNNQALSLLPEGTRQQLVDAKKELNDIQEILANAKKKNASLEKGVDVANAEAIKRSTGTQPEFIVAEAKLAQKVAQDKLDANRRELASAESTAANIASKFISVGNTMFDTGVTKLTTSLAATLAEGGVVVAKSYLSVLKSAGGDTAAAEGQLRQKELDIQLDLISATYNNILSQEALKLSLDKLALLEERKNTDPRMGDVRASIDKKLSLINTKQQMLDTPSGSIVKMVQAINAAGGSNADARRVDLPDENVRTAIREMPSVVQAAVLRAAQEGKIQSDKKAAAIQSRGAVIDEATGNKQKQLKSEIDILNAQRDQIVLAQSLTGIFDDQLQRKKYALDVEIAEKQYLSDKLIAEGNIEKAGSNKLVKERADRDLVTLEAKNIQTKIDLEVKNTQSILAGKEEIRKYEQETTNRNIKNITDAKSVEISAQEQILSFKQSMGYIDEANAAKEQASIDRQKQYNSALLEANAIKNTHADIISALEAKKTLSITTATASGKPVDTSAIDARIATENEQYEEQKRILEERNRLNQANIDLIESGKLKTAEWNKLFADQKDTMDIMVNATAALSIAFGEVGAAIGAFGTVLGKTLEKQLQADKKIEENRRKYEKDPKQLAKEEEKYANKSVEIKLDAIQEVSGAIRAAAGKEAAITKGLLAMEKTIATYKLVMAAKVMAADIEAAITRMQMDAQAAAQGVIVEGEMVAAKEAFRAAELTGVVASEAEKNVAKIPGVFTAFMSQMGPWGWAAAAAALAALGIGALGGGSSKPPGGFTAEDQQSVQGSGISWKNGEKVLNGGGALGDSSKVSTAIVDGLETLAKNNYELLVYSRSKMYEALKGIQDNTFKFVKMLGDSLAIGGLGTKETSSKSALGFSKSSVSVEDKGINITGSVKDLQAGKGTTNTYENVKTSKSTVWGLFKSTNFNTNIKELKDDAKAVIGNIFDSFSNALTEASGILGADVKNVQSIIENFKIEIHTSSLGLTGDEFAKAVMAEIGNQLDIAAKEAFPNLAELSYKFQNFDETTTDFIIRLYSTAEDVKHGFESIGKNIDLTQFYTTIETTTKGFFGTVVKTISKMGSVTMAEFSQMLVERMGGVDEFNTKISNFADNFLTEAQRLAPVQAAVTKEMARLGYSGIKTREQFAELVTGFKITDKSSMDTFAALMNVSGAFAEVTPAIEEVKSSLQDLVSEFRDLTDQFDKLTMSAADYRTKQKKGMTPEEATQFDTNEVLRQQIDLITQRNELVLDNETKYMDAEKKLTYTREKERLAIDEVNYVIFDSITAMMQAQLAIDKAVSAMLAGFAKVTAAADKAKTAMMTAATQGLSLLEARSTSLMSTLISIAQQGMQILQTAAQAAVASQKSLAQTGYSKLVSVGDTLTNQLVEGYVSALEAQTQASKAYADAVAADAQAAQDASDALSLEAANLAISTRNALRDLSKSIREFLKEISQSTLNVASDATKLKLAQAEFSSMVTKAKTGDQEALAKLPEVSRTLLSVAQTQSKSKLEYARVYGKVTNELASITDSIDTKLGTEQEKAIEANKALANSSTSAATALATATTTLGTWSSALVASGIDIQAILDKRKYDASPEGIAANLATNKKDVTSWISMVRSVDSELADTITRLDPQTFADLSAAWTDAGVLVDTTNTALINWVNQANTILKSHGATDDQLLNIKPGTPTIDDIDSSMTTTADLLSQSRINTAAYITTTNAMLTAAGIKPEDLLKAADPITLDNITAKRDEAVAAYVTAMQTVVEWEDAMTAIGVSFTPYGDQADQSLSILVSGVTTANAAFADANSRVGSWVDSLIQIANDAAAKAQAVIDNAVTSATVVTENGPQSPTDAGSNNLRHDVPESSGGGTPPVVAPPNVPAANDGSWWFDSAREISSGSGWTYYSPSGDVPHYDQFGNPTGAATGGSTQGGAYIVGEKGPELINTGPASIYNRGDVGRMLNNDDLLNEIKALRQEVAQLRYSSEQTQENTRKSKDTLLRVSRDGNAIYTVAA